MTDTLASFQTALGHRFRDRKLLETAITHSSWRNEHPRCDYDNERLEFLGDAVLELTVSDALYHRYPGKREGALTHLRARLVCEEQLARIARGLGIGPIMRLGRGEARSGGADKPSILSDAYEALIGAIYLDAGFARASACVSRHMEEALTGAAGPGAGFDAKSRLQELAHARFSVTPVYRVIEETGPDHDRRFISEVDLPGVLSARGSGRTKKESETVAARDAHRQIATDFPEPVSEPPAAAAPEHAE